MILNKIPHGIAIIFFLTFTLISCQRSPYATTQRSYRNGKTSYVNLHPFEFRKTGKAKKVRRGETVRLSTPPIQKLPSVPVRYDPALIASAKTLPEIIFSSKKEYLPEPSVSKTRSAPSHLKIFQPDTARAKKTTSPPAHAPSSQKVERYALMGFILSIFGLIPGAGLPLAIVGLINGIKGLKRIKRRPSVYKGKGYAIAAIVMGISGIIISLIFLFLAGLFVVMSISMSGAA